MEDERKRLFKSEEMVVVEVKELIWAPITLD